MKKQKITNSFLIGIFVLTGLALLVGFIVWMGATKFLKNYDYYVTYFEESVGGLDKGSPVRYLGVSCGLVESINIAPDGRLVEVILKLDPNLNMNNNIVAKLEMAGLAGGKYIQLLILEQEHRRLNLSFTPPYPLVSSAPSQLDEIAQSMETIISDLKKVRWQAISDGLEGTLDGTSKLANNGDLRGIMANLQEITGSLNILVKQISESAISEQLETTSMSITKTAKSLENFSQKLNTKLDSINIPHYLNLMYTDFNSTFSSANNAIDAITNKFQSSMLGINILMEDINKTNKTLNKTLRNINESPYIFLTKPPSTDE